MFTGFLSNTGVSGRLERGSLCLVLLARIPWSYTESQVAKVNEVVDPVTCQIGSAVKSVLKPCLC